MSSSKQIEVDGVTYEIRELSIRDMAPHLAMMADKEGKITTSEFINMQLDMLVHGTYKDGELVGDNILNLNHSMVTEHMLPLVLEVNGLAGKAEGND